MCIIDILKKEKKHSNQRKLLTSCVGKIPLESEIQKQKLIIKERFLY